MYIEYVSQTCPKYPISSVMAVAYQTLQSHLKREGNEEENIKQKLAKLISDHWQSELNLCFHYYELTDHYA